MKPDRRGTVHLDTPTTDLPSRAGRHRRPEIFRHWLDNLRQKRLQRISIRWRDATYRSQAPAIFAGGCPRSGTTLLRYFLDSHPEISCGPESRLLLNENILFQRAPRERLARRFGIEVSDIEAMLAASTCKIHFMELFYAQYLASQPGKRRWADKTPGNVFSLEYIFRHFPDAKFIFVLRDGRDVVCSFVPFLKALHPRYERWDRLDTLRYASERWDEAVSVAAQFQSDPRCISVRYEDMVSDAESTMRTVFQFLGERWDPRVLVYHEHLSGHDNPHSFPAQVQPVHPQSLGRWRERLSQDEARVIEDRLGPLLRATGYTTDAGWITECGSTSAAGSK